MSHDVQPHNRAFDVIPDAVVADPIPPPAQFDQAQFLASMWVAPYAIDSVEDLALDVLWQGPEIVLEAFRGDDGEISHQRAL